VGEFVDQRNSGPPHQDCVNVHFFERSAFVLDIAPGHCFQLRREFRDASASVSLDYTYDDIFATAVATDAFTEHVERLPNPRCVPEKDFKDGPFSFR
jgi:hypothetical protein